jgi:hypothetical protein
VDIKGIRWEGVNWVFVLKIGTSGGPYEPASLHKMRGISLLSEGLLVADKDLCSLQLVEM